MNTIYNHFDVNRESFLYKKQFLKLGSPYQRLSFLHIKIIP